MKVRSKEEILNSVNPGQYDDKPWSMGGKMVDKSFTTSEKILLRYLEVFIDIRDCFSRYVKKE